MNKPPTDCSHCGYQIDTYAEALEALEGGGRCLMCGGEVAAEDLTRLLNSFQDEEVINEGQERNEYEGEIQDEDEELDGPHDFGDEGEDEEDPIL